MEVKVDDVRDFIGEDSTTMETTNTSNATMAANKSEIESELITQDLQDLLLVKDPMERTFSEYFRIRISSIIETLHQKGDTLGIQFVPAFESDRKPTSVSQDVVYMRDYIQLMSPSSKMPLLARQEKLYTMSAVHERRGKYVSDRDVDAICYDTVQGSIEGQHRLLSEGLGYDGDLVRLVGGSYSPRVRTTSKLFDLDKYLQNIASIKPGGSVIVFDAKGKKHGPLIVKKSELCADRPMHRIINFTDGHHVDTRVMKAMVFSASTETENMVSRRQILSKGVIVCDALVEDEVLMIIKALRPTAREIFRFSQLGSSVFSRFKRNLIDNNCAVRSLLLSTTPDMMMMGGGSKPKGQKSLKAIVTATTGNDDKIMSQWDLAVLEISNSLMKNKKELSVEFEDGTRVTFDKEMVEPIGFTSSRSYPGGVATFASLLRLDLGMGNDSAKHQGQDVFYLSYPYAARISLGKRGYEIQEIILPLVTSNRPDKQPHKAPLVKEATFDTCYPLKRTSWELSNDDDNDHGGVLNQDDGDEAETADPMAKYNMLSSESEENVSPIDLRIDHYAAEPIVFFLEAIGPHHRTNQDQIDHLLLTSDRIRGDDVEAKTKAEIAESRVTNLKTIVSRFIRDHGNSDFPRTWGKDVRDALRAIEVLVQREPAYSQGLDAMNRKSVRILSRNFMSVFVANFAAEVLMKLPVLPRFDPVHRCRPPTVMVSRSGDVLQSDVLSYLNCVLVATVGKEADAKEAFAEVVGVRPGVKDALHAAASRVDALFEMRGIKETSDSRPPAPGSATGKFLTSDARPTSSSSNIDDDKIKTNVNDETFVGTLGPIAPLAITAMPEMQQNSHNTSALSPPTDATSLIATLSATNSYYSRLIDMDMNSLSRQIIDSAPNDAVAQLVSNSLDLTKEDFALSTGLLSRIIKTLCLAMAKCCFPKFEQIARSPMLRTLPKDDAVLLYTLSQKQQNQCVMVVKDGESVCREVVSGIVSTIEAFKPEFVSPLARYEANMVMLYIIISICGACKEVGLDVSAGLAEGIEGDAMPLIKVAKQKVIAQRQSSKDASIDSKNKLSDEARRVEKLLRQTFGKIGVEDWDTFVDAFSLEESRSMNQDEGEKDYVVVDVDADAAHNDEEPEESYVLPDEDMDDDEINEDMY